MDGRVQSVLKGMCHEQDYHVHSPLKIRTKLEYGPEDRFGH